MLRGYLSALLFKKKTRELPQRRQRLSQLLMAAREATRSYRPEVARLRPEVRSRVVQQAPRFACDDFLRTLHGDREVMKPLKQEVGDLRGRDAVLIGYHLANGLIGRVADAGEHGYGEQRDLTRELIGVV